MKTVLLAVLVLLMLAGDARSQLAAPPQWYLDDIAVLSAGTGRWITDNSAYRSDAEPWGSYGTSWTASFDGTTMSGRLFAIEGGKETTRFWEFRQYWHPGKREAVLEQFGRGGKLVIGRMTNDGHVTTIDQTAYAIDGSLSRGGHESRFLDSATYFTESFNVKDGLRTPNRAYTWRRIEAESETLFDGAEKHGSEEEPLHH